MQSKSLRSRCLVLLKEKVTRKFNLKIIKYFRLVLAGITQQLQNVLGTSNKQQLILSVTTDQIIRRELSMLADGNKEDHDKTQEF